MSANGFLRNPNLITSRSHMFFSPVSPCLNRTGFAGGRLVQVTQLWRGRPAWRELPIDVIDRTQCSLVADRGSHGLARIAPLQTRIVHQACDSATGNGKILTVHLPPDFAHLRRKSVRCRAHLGSTCSEVGASSKPGTPQDDGRSR